MNTEIPTHLITTTVDSLRHLLERLIKEREGIEIQVLSTCDQIRLWEDRLNGSVKEKTEQVKVENVQPVIIEKVFDPRTKRNEQPYVTQEQRAQDILAWLRQHPGMWTSSEIARGVGAAQSTVWDILRNNEILRKQVKQAKNKKWRLKKR